MPDILYCLILPGIFKTTSQFKISPFTDRETGSAIINDLFNVTKPKIGRVNLNLGQSIAEYKIL